MQQQLRFLQSTGKARAVESAYLNQLVVMKIVRKERKGRKAFFQVDLEAVGLVKEWLLEEEKKLHKMILAVSSLLRVHKKRNLFFVAENGEGFRRVFPRIARKLTQKRLC